MHLHGFSPGPAIWQPTSHALAMPGPGPAESCPQRQGRALVERCGCPAAVEPTLRTLWLHHLRSSHVLDPAFIQ